MQDNYDAIKAKGAELIAISSDNVAGTKDTVGKEGLGYIVLSDSNKETIGDYNVVDPNNKHIARPSTYIILKDGTVGWKFLDVRLGNRIPTADIIAELGKL